MTVSPVQNSFIGGIFSRALYSRFDLAKYPTAVRRMENMFIHPQGGASNRVGTRFIDAAKNNDKKCRLYPFQFSVIQGYVLEFGHNYIRYYKDGGKIIGVETTTTYTEEELAELKFVQSADVLYIYHPNHKPAKLSRTSHVNWTLSDISYGTGTATPTGLNIVPLGVASTYRYHYAVTAVDEDTGVESLPIMGIITNSNLVGINNANKISWNAVSGASHYRIYRDGGTDFAYSGITGVIGSYGFISNCDEPKYQDGVCSYSAPDYMDNPPIGKTPFDGAEKYPGVPTFYGQRLVSARTNNEVQAIWGSRVGDFRNMNVSFSLKDDDAYSFTMDSNQVNEILWMIPLRELLIGTPKSEWVMRAGANSNSITPIAVSLKPQSNFGSANIIPAVIGNNILLVERSKEVVRSLQYSFDVDGYDGSNLCVFAESLFQGYEIVEMAYQKQPDSIVWVIRNDGRLLGLTYYVKHEIFGWHEHITDTDGEFESVAVISDEDGIDNVYFIVKRIDENGAVIRNIEMFADRLPFNDLFERDVKDSFFVDCGVSLDNPIDITNATKANPVVISATGHGFSNGDTVDIVEVKGMTELNNKRFLVKNKTVNDFQITTEAGVNVDGTGYTAYIEGGHVRKAYDTVSGLSHLEGKAVAVLSDGSVVNGKTVSGGAITLPAKASRIHVGLPYASILETLDFEFSLEGSTLQDKTRDVKSVVISLENTRGLWVGSSDDEDDLIEVPVREEEEYGQPIQLFNGNKEVLVESSEGLRGRVFIKNPDPIPLTILGIIPKIEIS